jgi:hypothetical protein
MQPLPHTLQDALRRGLALHVSYADGFQHRLVMDTMPVLPIGWVAYNSEELVRRPQDLYVVRNLDAAAKRLQRLSKEHGGYVIVVPADQTDPWAHAPRLRTTAQYRAERAK